VQVPQLEQGSTGPSVAALQTLLGGLTVDGVFGPLTHDGVVHFQAAHNLTQDGIVGVHTWGSLLGHPQ
jgi:peptidoglycan hydrolase-like protein with peptidoglycan-binding domain